MVNTQYKKYEINSRRCRLEIGDPVTPETVIGLHHATDLPIRAGLNGQVAAIYFNPMHDSFMVLAVSDNVN
jgi:hypothetical protein